MFKFEGDGLLTRAIIDGVQEMHRAHAARGSYDSHDLINWLNVHRNRELNDIIAYYASGDAVNVATIQISNYLKNRLDQRKLGDRISTRHDITLNGGIRDGGDCEVSIWEISPSTRAGVARARVSFPDCGGGPGVEAPADLGWLAPIAGTFKDEPAFAEVVELGRAYRREGRQDEPSVP